MNVLELTEKLVEDREKLDKAILSNCPIPVFTTSKDGGWLSVNKPFANLLAVESDSLLALRWQKLIVPGELRRVKRLWQAIIDGESTVARIKFVFRAGDGRQVPGYGSLVRLSDGRWIGFMMPICEHPSNCPVHNFLLHNIEASGCAAKTEED